MRRSQALPALIIKTISIQNGGEKREWKGKLIRCRDCRHRYTACPLIKVAPDGYVMVTSENEGYCNHGER